MAGRRHGTRGGGVLAVVLLLVGVLAGGGDVGREGVSADLVAGSEWWNELWEWFDPGPEDEPEAPAPPDDDSDPDDDPPGPDDDSEPDDDRGPDDESEPEGRGGRSSGGPVPKQQTGDDENPVPWGLDRIDQRELPLNNEYRYNATGAGVTVYIVDSGVYRHNDFRSEIPATGYRLRGGFNVHDGGDGARDEAGHGTGVASIIGGLRYGVAKDVELVPVRLADPDYAPRFRNQYLVRALEWIRDNHESGPGVVNLSGRMNPEDDIEAHAPDVHRVLTEVIDGTGLTVVVSAGNRGFHGPRPGRRAEPGDNACREDGDGNPVHPTIAHPGTIVVASSTIVEESDGVRVDKLEDASNYGDCVDIVAPGAAIPRASNLGPNAERNTGGGTSYAVPHVSGVAALYLEVNPEATPAQVREVLRGAATPNRLRLTEEQEEAGTPNRLLCSWVPQPCPDVHEQGVDEETTPPLRCNGFDILFAPERCREPEPVA